MDILQTLLENEILTEDTKKELETAIKELVEESVNKAKEETEINVRAELAEQFVTDKEALVEALDTKVQQFLESELAEFKDDVETFRDLEAEHAENLVKAKKDLAERAKSDFTQLVNILNEFLEERVTAEFEELKEDIEEVKRLQFGAKIYESFKEVFEKEYFDEEEIHTKAKIAESELAKTKAKLNETNKALKAAKHEMALTEALSSLSGPAKEVMRQILEKVETDQIPKVYDKFIGRVLNESVVDENAEKEAKVLAENSKTHSGKETVVTETVAVTGNSGNDDTGELIEDLRTSKLSEAQVERIRELIGAND